MKKSGTVPSAARATFLFSGLTSGAKRTVRDFFTAPEGCGTWSFYICQMKILPMKGRGSPLVMAPEGPELIAHGFSRGKGDDGTRGALEGRYKRRLPFACRRRMSCGSYGGGQKSLRKDVSPLSGLLAVIALYPRLEAVGYDLPAPSGRNPRRTAPLGRCLGSRSQLSEAERRPAGLSRHRNFRCRKLKVVARRVQNAPLQTVLCALARGLNPTLPRRVSGGISVLRVTVRRARHAVPLHGLHE